MEISGQPLESTDWETIKQKYTPETAGFLDKANGISRKSKSGALILKSPTDLKICEKIQIGSRGKKLSTKPVQKNENNIIEDLEEIPGAEVLEIDDDYDDNFNLCYDFRRLTEFGDVIDQRVNYLSDDSEDGAMVFKTYKDVEPLPIIKKAKLENVKEKIEFDVDSDKLPSSKEIFDIICDEKVMSNVKIKISSLIPILAELKEKHERFDYFTTLWGIMRQDNTKDKTTIKVVYKFCSHLLFQVVPEELFGSRRNRKLLLKIIKKYLTNTFYLDFPYEMCNILHSDDLRWLHGVYSHENKFKLKYIITEWFFDSYIIGVLKSMFMCTKTTYSSEKIYILRYLWRQKKNEFFLQMKRTGMLQEEDLNDLSQNSSDNFRPTEAILKLYPKAQGLRPVYMLQNDTPQNKSDRLMIKKLLIQLFKTNFKVTSSKEMYNVWKNTIEQKKNNPSLKHYFVSTDIDNAYPSIDQNKLLDIINKLMINLPRVLTFRRFQMLKSGKCEKKPSKYMTRKFDFFVTGDDRLVVPLPPDTLVCELGCKQIRTVWLQEKIVSYILNQVVLLGKGKYILKKGVAQGLSFASILSEIYYATLVNEVFDEIKKTGTLIRYVDDFLYITEDKKSAEKFLEYVEEGIPSFNCKFSEKKTKTNVENSNIECCEKFKYLGYEFDMKNFQVFPHYSKEPVLYLISLNIAASHGEFKEFKIRIMNMQMFKLQKLILDPEINSPDRIEKTVTAVGKLAAQKCFVLLLNLFKTEQLELPIIWLLIKRFVHFLLYSMTKDFPLNEKQRNKFERIIWSEFKIVFSKNIALHRIFGKRIKSQSRIPDFKLNLVV